MEAYLEQQTPGRTVALDPDVLMQLGTEGTVVFPDHGPQIIAAARDGEPFVVPMSTYLARTSGQPFAEKLNSAATFREGGVSVEEGKELPAPSEVAAEPAPIREVTTPPDFTPEESTRTRTIAADAHREVDTLVQELRLRDLFTEAKAVGSTKSNFERYSAGVEEAIAAATDRMTARAVAAVRRERMPEFKERMAQHEAAVEVELGTNPAVRARAYLAQGKDPLGAPVEAPFKLDRSDAIAQYGRDLGLPDRMFGRDGLTADDAADILGYPSGADLIRDLSDLHSRQGDLTIAQHMKAMIREEALARTRDELGYDVSPEALRQAASEALVVPQIENFLADDLKSFADENGLPFDKAATKQFALDRFAQRPVKQAINLRQLESWLARDGRKLETALLKGDIPAAFRWKQLQYLHTVELAQAHKFLKTWNRGGRNIAKWAKRRSMPSMAQPYLDRIHEALIQHGVPTKRDMAELARGLAGQSLEQWVAAAQNLGQSVEFADVPAGLAPNAMTVEQFTQWNNMLTSIAVNGKREADPFVPQMVDEALAAASGLPDKPQSNTVGDWSRRENRVSALLTKIDAGHSIMESLFDYMDGGDVRGPHNRVLMDGATDAANTADRMQQDIYAPMVRAFEAIPAATRAKYGTRIANVVMFNPLTNEPLTLHRGDLVSVLLNMGTAANRTKLAEGYGTSPEFITALLDQHITREEADFAQFVWDSLTDKLFPIADANARKLRGYGLTKVPAESVPLAVGTLRGGYYPLDYDPKFRNVPDAYASADHSDPFVQPFHVLSTPSGFEQERMGFVSALNLSLDSVIRQHLRDVVTRVAYGDFVATARRFITNKSIRALWRTKLGQPYYFELMPWLENQVMDVGMKDVDQTLMRGLRQNMTVAYMGGKWSVGIGQLQGAVPVFSELGSAWTIRGYASFLLDVLTGKTQARIYTKSEEMHFRHLNLEQNVRDVNHEMSRMDITRTPMERFRREVANATMAYINWMDKYMVSGAAWKGAYTKARLGMGMSEGDSIRYADKIVRKTQGTGRLKDLPAVQRRSNEFQRMVVFAYTWPGRLYNLQREAARMMRAGQFVSGSRRAFWLFFAVPVVAALFSGDLPRERDRAHPEAWLWWITRKMALGALGNSVWTRDAAQTADRLLSGKSALGVSTPLGRLLDSVFSVVKLDRKGVHLSTKNWVRAWANMLGLFGFLPASSQIGASSQFLLDTAQHRAHPRDPNDWFEGLTTGRLEKRK